MRSEDSLYDEENNLKEKLNPDNLNELDDFDNDKVSYTLRLSKSIKYFTLSDIIINLLWVFISPWYVFPPMFAFIGYIGYLKYNIKCLYTYLIFLLLYICFKIIYLINATTNNTYSNEILILGAILGSLSTLSNLYVSRFIYKFIKNIENLSNNEKNKLINAKIQPKKDLVFW